MTIITIENSFKKMKKAMFKPRSQTYDIRLIDFDRFKESNIF